MYESYLAHHGIKGQKWGIRRFQPYSVRGRKSGKGGKEVGEAKKKGPSKEELLKSTNAKQVYNYRDQLSDRELRERVNRIQTEQQLEQLSKTSAKKGQVAADRIMSNIENAAIAGISAAAVKAGKAAVPIILSGATVAVASVVASSNPYSPLWLI